jgi:hypothetical protein
MAVLEEAIMRKKLPPLPPEAADIKGLYVHFKKGDRYDVEFVGRHTETLEPMVAYKDAKTGEGWVQPLGKWIEPVPGRPRTKRFRKCDHTEALERERGWGMLRALRSVQATLRRELRGKIRVVPSIPNDIPRKEIAANPRIDFKEGVAAMRAKDKKAARELAQRAKEMCEKQMVKGLLAAANDGYRFMTPLTVLPGDDQGRSYEKADGTVEWTKPCFGYVLYVEVSK